MIARLLAHIRRSHTTVAAYTALIVAIAGGGGYAVAATVMSTPTITGRYLPPPYPDRVVGFQRYVYQHNLKISQSHGGTGEYIVQVTDCGHAGSEIVASPFGFGGPPSSVRVYGGKANRFVLLAGYVINGAVTPSASQGFTIIGECN